MRIAFLFSLLFFSFLAEGNNPGVSYQGRIVKPDGTSLEASSVQFRMQVRSPGSENCLLYEEIQSINMSGSSGIFSITLTDSNCLTELTTTHTNWNGYAAALANGQLIAAKVKAFLCSNATCNNLVPLATYYFAKANDPTSGGAAFTTDATGAGPNNSIIWSAANYFSGTFQYWTGRLSGTATTWSLNHTGSNAGNCANWTDNGGSGWGGNYGGSGNTDQSRWNLAADSCAAPKHLICVVNP